MVALLSPTALPDRRSPDTANPAHRGPRHLGLVPDPTPRAPEPSLAPVVPIHQSPAVSPVWWWAVAGVVALGLGLTLSTLGAEPPAGTWAEVRSSAVGGGAAPAAGEDTLVVQPGDTLWDLAATLAPDADRRAVVGLLERRNGGSELRVGQLLIIPRGLTAAG